MAYIGGYRKKGTGSIRRRTGIAGFEVWTPKRGPVPAKYLGAVDFYRDGEKMLTKWCEENPEVEHGQA